MTLYSQPRLFGDDEEAKQEPKSERKNLGTFQDSLRAPVHSWFTYPAGFSYKAVEEILNTHRIGAGSTIYDPFAGTGTTNVVASQRGIDSIGVEAHPFVYFVAQTKLDWDFDFVELNHAIKDLINSIKHMVEMTNAREIALDDLFPELVRKCYSPEKLFLLYLCREAVRQIHDEKFRNFAKLALTSSLRSVADVATGWPYIAPQKAKNSNGKIKVVKAFDDQLRKMAQDLNTVRSSSVQFGHAQIIGGDSRQKQNIEANSIDLAFTSPPYLNNYDYADRTRLEMYFWGEALTWGDITERVRTRLMMSATTQINRSDYDQAHLLSEDLCILLPEMVVELQEKIAALSQLRLQKGGKKSYDIMVAGYFNDMLCVIGETFRILKPGAAFVLILGDSAPYGVYIPTHTYLGEIGKAVGFVSYEVEKLRTRGGKWKDNPQEGVR